MKKFKTQEIKEIVETINALEILIQRTVHQQTIKDYEIKNGLVTNPDIDMLREKLELMLTDLDEHLFKNYDDGK